MGKIKIMKLNSVVKLTEKASDKLGLPPDAIYVIDDILEDDIGLPLVLRVDEKEWLAFFGNDWREFVSEDEVTLITT
jgi:phenylpyruvate tautomerase PptA (4-oxalocrotonate tautomerase family)